MRSSYGVVFSACFLLIQSDSSFSSTFSLFPSSLSFPPSPLAWPPPPGPFCPRVWGWKAAYVPISAARWHSGMLGASHIAGVSCWDVRQWLIFKPLHTRPQQMTTCREAKQGMRWDWDNWNGCVCMCVCECENFKRSGNLEKVREPGRTVG